MRRRGFTLIEVMVTIAIVGILATIVFIAVAPTRNSAFDARRKIEVSQIGRLITLGCYVPDAGEGDYDLIVLINELKSKYPQYAGAFAQIPRDPSKGTATESFYRYIVNAGTKKCSVYANLQNTDERVTLPNLSAPSAGGGIGVLEASANGWNGTNKYFQYSN